MLVNPGAPDIVKHPDRFRAQLRELPAFRALLRSVEADFYADLPMPPPVLDLGCGDGLFAASAFAQHIQVGLDPWWRPLKQATRSSHYGVLTCAAGDAIPFAASSFRTVVSNSVLEHIPDVDPVVSEVARILQPGGWFYFCVPGPNFRQFLSVARFLDAIRLRRLAETYRRLFDRISRHRYYNTPEQWVRRLAGSGFVVERWWTYFSRRALAALEWGHPLGAPNVINHALTGKWVIFPRGPYVALSERILKPVYAEELPDTGAYLFFVARKAST